jgi:hypothetical protein
MSNTVTEVILLREQSRCEAMCANDLQALDLLLDTDLRFAHATGAVDDKSAYLEKMAQARIVYRSIRWSEQNVAVLGRGDAALLTGRMTSNVSVNGVDKLLDNRVLAVWLWNSTRNTWRLRAFQPTPLPQA